MEKEKFLSLAKKIMDTPTAPFYEKLVSEKILETIERIDNLSAQYDRFGNLIVNYIPPAGTSDEIRPIVGVAHMDHPGLEITEVRGNLVVANFNGYVSPEYLLGANVVIQTKTGAVKGKITDIEYAKEQPSAKPEDQAEAEPQLVLFAAPRGRSVESLALSVEGEVEPGDYGHFDFPLYKQNGDVIRALAADDLAGCSTVLATLLSLSAEKPATRFAGVFTRCEEAGFIGAMAMVKEKMLPENGLMISVESSSYKAGAKIGGGPVIRLGDRLSLFDLPLINLMRRAAANLTRMSDMFKCQQLMMDRGTCEGTVFSAFGWRTAGIAIPLGNYHNMNDDPNDPHLRPEYVNADDLWWSYMLLKECAKITPTFDEELLARRKRLTERSQKLVEKLLEKM